MTTQTDSLNLILLPNSDIWHICRESDLVVCTGRPIGKQQGVLEVGLDSRVVSHRGKRVCLLCRRGMR